MCVMFSCVFVTFPYSVLGQLWYLIVSIPDLCLFSFIFKVVFNSNSEFDNFDSGCGLH